MQPCTAELRCARLHPLHKPYEPTSRLAASSLGAAGLRCRQRLNVFPEKPQHRSFSCCGRRSAAGSCALMSLQRRAREPFHLAGNFAVFLN